MRRIVFLTQFFPGASSGAGPWCERYNGLYGKLFRSGDGNSLQTAWYDLQESTLREMTGDGWVVGRLSLYRFLWRELLGAMRMQETTTMVVAYPIFGTRDVVASSFTAVLLRVMRLTGKVRVLIDFIDPPLMMISLFVKNPLKRMALRFFRRRQEQFLLRSANIIVTNAPEMGSYLRDEHLLTHQEFTHIPMGLDIPAVQPSLAGARSSWFTLCYGGVLSADRGILELYTCLERVNTRFPVTLVCCGRVDPNLELPERPWLKIYSGLGYQEYMEFLMTRADAGIIPYPVNDWWGSASISKLATYAAAGIPILSTDLAHTRRFLAHWKCGLVAISWQEMEDNIIHLYEDRPFCGQLGRRARIAAEQALDWNLLTRSLAAVIQGDGPIRKAHEAYR